jgi:hypothetical protein
VHQINQYLFIIATTAMEKKGQNVVVKKNKEDAATTVANEPGRKMVCGI